MAVKSRKVGGDKKAKQAKTGPAPGGGAHAEGGASREPLSPSATAVARAVALWSVRADTWEEWGLKALPAMFQLVMVLGTALAVWGACVMVLRTSSPIVVVLSGSMEPGVFKGDLLVLRDHDGPYRTGEVLVFRLPFRSVPIVHRVVGVYFVGRGRGRERRQRDRGTERRWFLHSFRSVPISHLVGGYILWRKGDGARERVRRPPSAPCQMAMVGDNTHMIVRLTLAHPLQTRGAMSEVSTI